ncbi:hypothetical protein [Bradyrhizobium agreste]|uniref:hypothetical protein n=1 Tax=Bradyrhizobium agreste TaxID=2751811 RepID=UPI001AED768D|nr:hypothetical protein [Bradyrhizobium agreste]
MGLIAPLFATPHSQFARINDRKLKAHLFGLRWPSGQKPTTIAPSIEMFITTGPACCGKS